MATPKKKRSARAGGAKPSTAPVALTVVMLPTSALRPFEQNPRKISDAAIKAVAGSLKEFGWRQPIVVDPDMVIVAGHTRWLAAQRLGLAEVPVHVAKDLSPEQLRAYRLADNRTGEESEWDDELLIGELRTLGDLGFNLDTTGFASDLERLLGPSDPGSLDPGTGRYAEQYGVIVVCQDEAEQQKVFEQLSALGLKLRLVVT